MNGLTRRRLALLVLLAAASACGGLAQLPAQAPADCPPRERLEPLVRLSTLDEAIREDIRYATANNFTGAPLPGYEVGAALLRPEPARSLARVQQRLREQGYGMLVFDAYRPVRGTLAMVAWAERTGNRWVLEQGYVAHRSGHNRGHTVDLTLYELETGQPLDMGTAYDEFTEAAHTMNAGGPAGLNRIVLLRAMEDEGWRNYEKEWWHFTHPSTYEPLDVPIHCYVGRPAQRGG